MKKPLNMIEIVRENIILFCKEFVESPYICYTEHSQHARFYKQFYHALPEDMRYIDNTFAKIMSYGPRFLSMGDLVDWPRGN